MVVDDHPMIRERLRQVIEAEKDLSVCGEAEESKSALELILRQTPDLVLVDLRLKGSDGLGLIKEVHAKKPELPMLVISMHEESLFAERAIRAGAMGFISKQEATRKVIDAIRTVLRGGIFLSSAQVATTAARIVGRRKEKTGMGLEALTDRELSVFELLGEGWSTREIADRLRLRVRTIETYRARTKEKLKLTGAHSLLQQAIRWVEGGESTAERTARKRK
jgi:DNA-binding NarL/FixJ family response regulator